MCTKEYEAKRDRDPNRTSSKLDCSNAHVIKHSVWEESTTCGGQMVFFYRLAEYLSTNDNLVCVWGGFAKLCCIVQYIECERTCSGGGMVLKHVPMFVCTWLTSMHDVCNRCMRVREKFWTDVMMHAVATYKITLQCMNIPHKWLRCYWAAHFFSYWHKNCLMVRRFMELW